MEFIIHKNEWNTYLSSLSKNNIIYAPFTLKKSIDFNIVDKDNVSDIVYNSSKTLTPLKNFLFSLKENVTIDPVKQKVILIGAKGCDLAALDILDKVFVDPDFPDPFYRERRENTLIIGTDCYSTDEHCHCTAYGIDPYAEKNCDIQLNAFNDKILITEMSERGEEFVSQLKSKVETQQASGDWTRKKDNLRKKIKSKLKTLNKKNPDSANTKKIIQQSVKKKDKIWEKYASTCVSCGACVVSCPTCHCFLLVDLPGSKMDKVRIQDGCQYPGFERVSAGADPLEDYYKRFRNRYICKFINRPEKYDTIACTGCGRCIDVCIGKINKNDLIRALR